MNKFLRLRLPFREDKLFGVVLLLILVVPWAFSIVNYEKFETLKISLWLVLLVVALLVFLKHQTFKAYSYNPGFLTILAIFLLLNILSTVFSIDKASSIFDFNLRFTNSLMFYTVWVVTTCILLG